MSNVNHSSGANRSQSLRNRRNPYEAESGYSRPKTPQIEIPLSREGVRDVAYNAARGFGDALGNAATGIIDEVTGFDRNQDQNEPAYSAPDRGGVHIPTFAEYQKEQEKVHTQFFLEQQRAAELVSRKRKEDDDKRIDEIKQVLKDEIDRFQKLQTQMNEHIEKAKKLLLIEQQEFKKGLYHITIAEVLLMALRNALVDISNSNNWLEAMMSKKKKRGSLFSTRSKQQGTQYSLSQELSISRSTG